MSMANLMYPIRISESLNLLQPYLRNILCAQFILVCPAEDMDTLRPDLRSKSSHFLTIGPIVRAVSNFDDTKLLFSCSILLLDNFQKLITRLWQSGEIAGAEQNDLQIRARIASDE
jgi:hypothetical protein